MPKGDSQKSIITDHAMFVATTLAEVFEHAAYHLMLKTGKFEGLEEAATEEDDQEDIPEDDPNGRPRDEFLKNFFEQMLNDPDLDPYSEPVPTEGGQDQHFVTALIHSCMCAASAVRKADSGDLKTAQLDLFEALYWCGITVGYANAIKPANEAIKRLTRRATDALHAENRAMKAQVLEWYAANRHQFANKDEAAFAAANKLVPAEFSTVRGWLKEPKKKLP
jgi:hypothetical protein